MPKGKKFGGRTEGTQNKKTVEVLDRVERVLSIIERQHLEKDIKELSANQRMILYASLMEYKAPKLSRSTIDGNSNHAINISFVKLDED